MQMRLGKMTADLYFLGFLKTQFFHICASIADCNCEQDTYNVGLPPITLLEAHAFQSLVDVGTYPRKILKRARMLSVAECPPKCLYVGEDEVISGT